MKDNMTLFIRVSLVISGALTATMRFTHKKSSFILGIILTVNLFLLSLLVGCGDSSTPYRHCAYGVCYYHQEVSCYTQHYNYAQSSTCCIYDDGFVSCYP